MAAAFPVGAAVIVPRMTSFAMGCHLVIARDLLPVLRSMSALSVRLSMLLLHPDGLRVTLHGGIHGSRHADGNRHIDIARHRGSRRSRESNQRRQCQ